MRALLVNPCIHDFASYDLWSKPLGLLNIASTLKGIGCKISLIDCLDRFHPELKKFLDIKHPKSTPYGSGPYYSEPIQKPAIFKSIKRRFKRYGMPIELFEKLIAKEPRPDVILVTSGMTYWYPGVIEAIKILKNKFPDVPLILGGVYATICYKHALEYSGADFVYKGSDIKEIIELVSKITDANFNYPEIGKRLFPSYGLYKELPYVTLRTSEGCPFKCSYCGWHLLRKEFIQADAGFVIDEIEYFSKNLGVKNFSFYDDALLYNAENHIIKILEGILKKGIKANFHTPSGLHIRFITPGIAQLLKRAGFISPRLGFETAEPRRQIETGSKTDTEGFLQALKYLKNAGYRSEDIAVYLLIGLPEQSIEEIRKSIEFVASEKTRIFLEEYSPIPGTPYYLKSGLSEDADPLMHNNSAFPLYRPDDCQKLQDLKNLAHNLNRKSC